MHTRVEIEAARPSSLKDKIDTKIWQSPGVLRSNERQMVFLEASIEAVQRARESSILFDEGFPEHPQDNVRVTLFRDSSTRAIKISISPKDLHSAATIWRASFRNGDSPRVVRASGLARFPVDYDPRFDESLATVVDNAHPVEKDLDDYTNAFFSRIRGRWSETDTREGLNALMMAELHHRGQRRKSGEPYIEHPWETVRELMELGFLNQPDLIKAAWAHDVAEDSPLLSQPEIEPKTGKASIRYSEWAKETEEILATVIGPNAARYVMLMTRPKPDGIEIFTKGQAEEMYLTNLKKEVEVLLIKMPDRLHNSRTLWAMPDSNKRATVISTVDYFSLFELAREKYPEATQYFISETRKALFPVAEEMGIDMDAI